MGEGRKRIPQERGGIFARKYTFLSHCTLPLSMYKTLCKAIQDKGLSPEDDRLLGAHFGLKFEELLAIWGLVPNIPVDSLLCFFFFLKMYPTDDVGSSWARLSPKTWRKRVRTTASILNAALPQINFCERFDEWNYLRPSCII